MLRRGLAVLAVMGACHPVAPQSPELTPQDRLHQATVTVADRCAGVLVADRALVLTAAHCLRQHEPSLQVAFLDGSTQTAQVAAVDQGGDVALLELPLPSPFEGLSIASALPDPGTKGFFAGRFDRGATVQDIEILRRAPCPSLPEVPEALFTSLRGTPGDSGAPVVDERFWVIGLVHGGAQCSVAAPTHQVPRMIETLTATARR